MDKTEAKVLNFVKDRGRIGIADLYRIYHDTLSFSTLDRVITSLVKSKEVELQHGMQATTFVTVVERKKK